MLVRLAFARALDLVLAQVGRPLPLLPLRHRLEVPVGATQARRSVFEESSAPERARDGGGEGRWVGYTRVGVGEVLLYDLKTFTELQEIYEKVLRRGLKQDGVMNNDCRKSVARKKENHEECRIGVSRSGQKKREMKKPAEGRHEKNDLLSFEG